MKKYNTSSSQDIPFPSFASSIPFSISYGSSIKPDSFFNIIKNRTIFTGSSLPEIVEEEKETKENK